GAGRIAELGAAVKEAGITQPLLVTDPRLAHLPCVGRALKVLVGQGIAAAVFANVKPNPVAAHVEAGLKMPKEGGHDGGVRRGSGWGGEAGKVIGLMAGQPRPMWDFEDVGDWWRRAQLDGILPIIAVPTTAGTGSEVGRAGVITEETSHTKKVIFHPKMMPTIAI